MRQLSSAALSEEKEAEIVSSLLVELTLAQAKVLAMLGSSDKALRKAVAKAAVLLWYAHFDPHQIAVKTYLRKGKEKLAVTWSYRAADGKRRQRSPAHRLPLTRAPPFALVTTEEDDGGPAHPPPPTPPPTPRLSPPSPPSAQAPPSTASSSCSQPWRTSSRTSTTCAPSR